MRAKNLILIINEEYTFLMAADPKELSKLEEGWDSYGAKQITDEAIATASSLRDSLHFVPLADGGIQIELHDAGLDFEVEIDPAGKPTSVWIGKAG